MPLPAALFPQQSGIPPADLSFTPFVSELEGEVKNNLIRLTWKDSPDVRGPVYIYRSQTPFDTARPGFGKALPAEVPYGVEYYIDETETTGTIYYFAASSDETGRRYDILLPFGNSVSVDIADLPFSGGASLWEEPKPAGLHGGIYALETAVLGEGVTISFAVNVSDRNLVLYRSVQPITRTIDLLKAVIVQSGLSSPFTDYPVPGIQYYYAVIFEDELTRGSVGIYPGSNATQKPVEVRAGLGRIGLPGAKAEIRSMPLPLMSLNYAVPGLEGLAEAPDEAVPLSPAARRAVESLSPERERPLPQKKPRAFGQDLDAEASMGEEQALKTIVQGYFIKGDWENSCAELRRYLSLHHSAGIAARARFYLAQALYFSHSYREALREFLLIKDFFPGETNGWISASLAALAE
ncbi:MAG: hypothetical protein LBH26_00565 [Treponema sp.]|nr:hypothetical protein [Treponema sp.]